MRLGLARGEIVADLDLVEAAAPRHRILVGDDMTLRPEPPGVAAPSAAARARVTRRLGWQHLAAVRAGRVYGGFDAALVLRPGPRVLDGIDALAACIAPEPAAPAPETP